MSEFESWRSYSQFSASVTKEWRYTRNADQEPFLHAVVRSAGTRLDPIPAGAEFWRAQLGHEWRREPHYGEDDFREVPSPYGRERMKPLRNQATEGRANPKGIACLYMSSRRETAIAEVRPWVGALVSVAPLRIQRPLKIVNCSSESPGFPFHLTEPTATEREAANWQLIDQAFSQPVTHNDQLADYAPTQILAEVFRKEGFDGIAYHSALGPGHNVAVFDLDAVDVVRCDLCSVKSVTFVTEDQG